MVDLDFHHVRGLLLVTTAQVVLANGTIVTASNAQNPDLFFVSSRDHLPELVLTFASWSGYPIRSAAPSFGIVTTLTIKMKATPSSNILFQDVFDASNSKIAETFATNNALPQLGISGYFTLSGVYYGTKTQFTAAMKPFLAAVSRAHTSSSSTTYD